MNDEGKLSDGDSSKLAWTRRLAGNELTEFAQRMVDSEDPEEVEKLRAALTHGFYGNWPMPQIQLFTAGASCLRQRNAIVSFP